MAKRVALVEILKKGADIVRRRGFQAAGLNDVLKAAGVPKGSFYHYFGSKEAFGLSLVEYHAGFVFARLEDFLEDTERPPLERLRLFFRDYGEDIRVAGTDGGSLLGNLAQEMAGQSPAFREKLREVYEVMHRQVLGCLEEAASRGELRAELATPWVTDFIIDSWEGAVLRAKVEDGHGPLESFDRCVFDKLLGFAAQE